MDNKKEKPCLTCYMKGEVKTAIGQLVIVETHPDCMDSVKESISSNIRRIDLPTTGRVMIAHGGFGMYTRYDIVQHKYGGGGSGFIEVLEIRNPPEGKCGFVVHHYANHSGSDFFEFDTVKNAVSAWRKCWAANDRHEKISKQKGFLRMVRCGIMTPWFYAVGDQLVEGDYVFLETIKESPEFRFDQRYIVWDDEEKVPAVKKCRGVRIFTEKDNFYGGGREKKTTVVYWDDGTSWQSGNNVPRPRLMREDELWIQEAMDKFRELLAGSSSELVINFIDGSKFIGKWKPADVKATHAEGNYIVKIYLKGGKVIEGSAPFKPTTEIPTLKAKLDEWAKEKGHDVERYEVVKITKTPKGKKWSGVYPEPKE